MPTTKVPALTGARIVSVHDATAAELKQFGVDASPYNQPLVLELDTGVKLVALRDPEGNGFGSLLGLYRDKQFYPSPEPPSLPKSLRLRSSPKDLRS